MTDVHASAQLWGVAPFAVWAAVFLGLVRSGRNGVEAFLQSLMLWAGLVWGLSNLLSFAGIFTAPVLRGVWAVLGLGAVIWIGRRCKGAQINLPKRFDGVERGFLLLGFSIWGLAFVRALVAPPNTVDVLNYHLPRQVYWLQDGVLSHYGTVNARENIMPPLAELIGAQFLGLTGDDRWANLPQAVAYAGLALAVALLARRLGVARKAALAAGVMALLMPMAHHEASGAKNDLMGAFWTVQVALVIEALRRMPAEKKEIARLGAWLGLAVALAWLTKSTSMLFLPPLILAGLGGALLRAGRVNVLRAGGVALLIWTVAVLPFYSRNLAGSGSLLGTSRAEDGGGQINGGMSPVLLASNLLRHATLHLVGPSDTFNSQLLSVVKWYHEATGLSVNDRRLTLWVTEFAADYFPGSETTAGAPVHFLLLSAVGFSVLLGGGGERMRRGRWLVWAVAGGTVLFCGVLKWQPWATRLELPLFALGLAPAALWWSRPGRGTLCAGFFIAAALLCWWPGADTEGRNLWRGATLWGQPRNSVYHANLPHLEARDAALTRVIAAAGAEKVELINLHDVQYPLMRRLVAQRPETRFVNEGEKPDAVIVLNLGGNSPLYRAGRSGEMWRLVGDGYGEGVYLPAEFVRERGWWNRLPYFAGWKAEKGLAVTGYRLENSPIYRGSLLGEADALLSYRSYGGAMKLAMTLVPFEPMNRQVTVHLQTDEGEVHEIEVFPAGVTAVSDISLPSSRGQHRLRLWQHPSGGDLLILRLVVNDAQPSRLP